MSPRPPVQSFQSFQVDVGSATPIYDQIITQVRLRVASGMLSRGDALPSVRQLAVELRINPNTVARAYRDLEAEGVVETRRGQGTFVAETPRRLSPSARRRALEPAALKLAAEAHALGLTQDETTELVADAWQRLSDRRDDSSSRRQP